jgi:hypothetical protein
MTLKEFDALTDRFNAACDRALILTGWRANVAAAAVFAIFVCVFVQYLTGE